MKPRGKLTIYFSYADGVGKTRAMLASAQAQQRAGRRVLVGETDGAVPDAAALGLPCLPPRSVRGTSLREFDLDAALARRPDVLVLPGLAHANPEGCRHEKRYQDVQELLRAGIDVCTTLLVAQLEGQREAAASLTGREEREWIPDALFDAAECVEFVDREPSSLPPLPGGPPPAQLLALRALAMRRCADRLSQQTPDGPAVSEHILVCLSSAPSNARVIRMAVRMANAFRCACTAVFVRNPGAKAMPAADRERLKANMKLAEQLGARVEIVPGEDVAFQIAEYARLCGATKIVLGRSIAARGHLISQPSITDRLIQLAPGIEIHILPDGEAQRRVQPRRLRLPHVSVSDFAKTLVILALATALSLVFYEMGFSEANIIMAYILGVLLTAVVTSNRLCSSATSIASVFIFNYLFTEPRFTLEAYDTGYPVTFLIMLLAALMTGTLASQLKNHAQEAAQTAYRTRVLFDTNQQLSQAADGGDILAVTAQQLIKLFKRDVVMYPVQDGELGEGVVYPAREGGATDALMDERRVAQWVLRSNRQAGATTDTFAQAKGLYLAIRISESIYGVAGIAMGSQTMTDAEHDMLLAVLGECALAMENERNVREKETAAMQARSEQLRADLLRAISHDLRTPLTAILGNASNLIANGHELGETTRRQIYTDIHDDATWLINLVENLLFVTRIEDGRMKLRCSVEVMDEILQEALSHESCKGRDHSIVVRRSDELLFARIDARLIIQVVINLVDNAIKYTPPGSHIELFARRDGGFIRVSCADDGPGIAPADREHLFEMFYSGKSRRADGRRSLGLGLGLCKSIVSAHGGTICAQDNHPRGTVFSFTVPAQEVDLDEQADDSGC
ncbi:MAG: sensor histidine kinase KdpD [Candidatus Ventricola sp.]|nr:sensor histidine kinase KdpD [Candidatus Ventricola sp.]